MEPATIKYKIAWARQEIKDLEEHISWLQSICSHELEIVYENDTALVNICKVCEKRFSVDKVIKNENSSN